MGNYHVVIVTRNCPRKTAFGEKANRILITRIRKSVSFVLARLFPYLTLFIDYYSQKCLSSVKKTAKQAVTYRKAANV